MHLVVLINSCEYLIRFPIEKHDEPEPNRLAFRCDAGISTELCLCLIAGILQRDFWSSGWKQLCGMSSMSEESVSMFQRNLDVRERTDSM